MKTVILSVGASVVLATLVAWGLRSPSVYVPPSANDRPIGALSGPTIGSPFLKWGDVATYMGKFEFSGSTSTDSWSPICSIASPTATSTLTLDTGVLFNNGPTTTTAKIRVFKAANSQSTTTELFAKDVAKGMDGIKATSSAAVTVETTVASTFIIAPNQFINFTVEGLANSHGRFIGSGTCQAGFVTAQL